MILTVYLIKLYEQLKNREQAPILFNIRKVKIVVDAKMIA